MKAVIQRVTNAHVSVDENVVGQIGPGLVVLLGITHSDGEKEASWLADKIVNLRIFSDDAGKMNRSLLDTGGNILVISQFTLYGDATYGRRPSFIDACRPEVAEPLYETFCHKVSIIIGKKVEKGIFGANMQVHLVNDGPVTMLVEKNAS